MKRFYRIDHQGQPRHVVEENGDWRLVEGDIFGQYDAGDRVAATGQVLLAPVQPSKIVAVGLGALLFTPLPRSPTSRMIPLPGTSRAWSRWSPANPSRR